MTRLTRRETLVVFLVIFALQVASSIHDQQQDVVIERLSTAHESQVKVLREYNTIIRSLKQGDVR